MTYQLMSNINLMDIVHSTSSLGPLNGCRPNNDKTSAVDMRQNLQWTLMYACIMKPIELDFIRGLMAILQIIGLRLGLGLEALASPRDVWPR